MTTQRHHVHHQSTLMLLVSIRQTQTPQKKLSPPKVSLMIDPIG